MKIIFASDQLQNGGTEREVAVFASTLAKLGHEVHIFCVKDLTSDYAIDQSVHVHHFALVSRVNIPKIRVLFRWRNAVPKLRCLHADIILSANLSFKYYPVLWLGTLFSGTKLLLAVRNNLEEKYTKKRDKRMWRCAAHTADAIWIQTEAQRRFFPDQMQEKIFEVPNILDPRFLEIPERERTEIRRIITVGRFHSQKNQKLLIEAFARMLEKTGNRDATLTIYGQSMPWEGPIENELKVLIQTNHLEERIFMPGRMQEIEKCYEQADAFLLGSDYEGLPNALMEAMAAGLPCISTDCLTGPSALIKSGENGLLVPVGDVEAMSQAVEYFVRHPQQAAEMGKAARKRMKTWESREELAGKLLENLRRICG